MKFKITQKDFGYLNEANQTNPVRWTILKEVGENAFEAQSNPLKCTDYFNDVVSYFQNKRKFSVYGFNNEVKFEDGGGLFVLVNNTKPNFEHNVVVINDQLKKDVGGIIEVCKDDSPNSLILYFPCQVFCNTYTMSLLMWVLRLSNYGLMFASWEDIFQNNASPANGAEKGSKSPALKQYALKNGFKVAEKFNTYWWFSGMKYNSVVTPETTGMTIHDCGCDTWVCHMKSV